MCSCDIKGAAPGTRETDLLDPVNTVQGFNALAFSGGSAFGLSVSDGVMRWLEKEFIGYNTPAGVVPIVSQAILFDLDIKKNTVRPDFNMGFKAAENANSKYLEEGTVGAGTGAVVGKALGSNAGTKGGIGSFSKTLSDGVTVAALVAVNSFGDVVSYDGSILAGARDKSNNFVSVVDYLNDKASNDNYFGLNTTLVCVAVDAYLDKSGAKKLAQTAHNGIARAIRPSHTMFDGDSVFSIATGAKKKIETNISKLGYFASLCVEIAIRRAVINASGLGGIPSYREIHGELK